jgi:hypothetical protein
MIWDGIEYGVQVFLMLLGMGVAFGGIAKIVDAVARAERNKSREKKEGRER